MEVAKKQSGMSMDTQGSQKKIGTRLQTHENEVGSTCCHHSFALSRTYFFKTLVLHAHRFQYRTRESENVLADFGFLKGPVL